MNQTPEQIARDHIDRQLAVFGWMIQDKSEINLHAALGVAVHEYLTDAGPADYLLFVHGRPAGVIEAERKEEGHKLFTHENQAENYAKAGIKYLDNEKLPLVYLSTGEVVAFTDFRDPKPRARSLFSFHRPETLHSWPKKQNSLRASLHRLPELPSQGQHRRLFQAAFWLEQSLKQNKQRAPIQMVAGAGKTFNNTQQYLIT
ncbi:MAG TPA: hypothetical protein PK843_17600 [bacterium]|nr:hypothetical protein [bacterium]